jgi:tetratricopeptide (TPR) repeat protein
MSITRRTALGLFGGALLAPSWAFGDDVSGKSFSGENPLGVPRPEFRAAQDGLDLIYQRRYKESLQVFEVAGVDFPDSAIGPVGRALVWQAVMYEDYDFDQERAYRGEYADGMDRIKRGRRDTSRKTWNDFLEAVLLGLDAMYDFRHGDVLRAFNKAWDAMELIKTVQRAAPTFYDVKLALGMYDYWRTVFSQSIDGLPNLGDFRAVGLAQMQEAREKGILAQAPAALVLAYSYLEKKDYKAAITEAEGVRDLYPGSVLIETTLGRVYRKADRFDDSLRSFERVLEINPRNKRVWFHIGETHYDAKKDRQAAWDAYEKYLATAPIDEYRAHTYYRFGLLERRARNHDQAIGWFEKCLELLPKFKKAKQRLEETVAEKERKAAPAGKQPRARESDGEE